MRLLSATEDLEDAHRPATAGTWFAQCERNDRDGRLRSGLGLSRAEQAANLRDVGLARSAGQQSIVPNAMESIGQDVDQEAADELAGGEPHHLLPVTRLDAVILPAEGNGPGVGADQTVVRDRHAVRVAAEVGQHRLGDHRTAVWRRRPIPTCGTV